MCDESTLYINKTCTGRETMLLVEVTYLAATYGNHITITYKE